MIMRSLKDCIVESLLDDEDKVFDGAKEGVVKEFLKENYNIQGSYTIKETKTMFIVDVKGDIEVANEGITSLTNGLFEFGEVSRNFDCSYCDSLKTLEGAPKEVGRDFACPFCDSLKTLEGAPKEVGKGFYCNYCKSLKTLEGAPQKVRGNFNCEYCKSLKTLEGAPEKVGENFNCRGCGIKFSTEDVKKYTKVSGLILVV